MVVFVGQSLPEGSPYDAAPFDGTPSGYRLHRWLVVLFGPPPHHITYTILRDCVRAGATKASDAEIVALQKTINDINPEHVVALGKVAADALEKAEVVHWKLPHPSGRHIRMSDVRQVQLELEECSKWLRGESYTYPVPRHKVRIKVERFNKAEISKLKEE